MAAHSTRAQRPITPVAGNRLATQSAAPSQLSSSPRVISSAWHMAEPRAI